LERLHIKHVPGNMKCMTRAEKQREVLLESIRKCKTLLLLLMMVVLVHKCKKWY